MAGERGHGSSQLGVSESCTLSLTPGAHFPDPTCILFPLTLKLPWGLGLISSPLSHVGEDVLGLCDLLGLNPILKTLSVLIHLSEPQLSHLQKGDDALPWV